jgi:DNA polymerase elongation subunit (family B)
MISWKNEKQMTKTEMQQEINDLKKLIDISSKVSVNSLLDKKNDLDILSKYNLTITPNGQFFSTQKEGFLPEMLGYMYEDRKKFKNLMLKAKQDYEEVLKELERRNILP